MNIKGRFAPSPSGRMHFGNLFSFFLAWLSSRSKGGKLVLRIEDLDVSRCSPYYAWQIIDDLQWLGLTWDEGVSPRYWQSNRSRYYEDAFQKLKRNDWLYPCFCSRIQRLSEAPHGDTGESSCPCSRLTRHQIAKLSAVKPYGWRIRINADELSITDGVQGSFSQNRRTGLDDFLVKRSDGAWAYQLAVCVDDAAMGVTEVVRGRDLLPSALKQKYLYTVLSLPIPSYYHVPLIIAEDKRRLSKRDRDTDMSELRIRYTPNQLVGLLTYTAGLIPDAMPLSIAKAQELFSWDKIPKSDIISPIQAKGI